MDLGGVSMATFRFKGLEEYEKMLSNISSITAVLAICGEVIDADAINALRFYGVEKIDVVSN